MTASTRLLSGIAGLTANPHPRRTTAMARELPDPLPATPRPVDWGQYDTGKPWELERGVDFFQEPKAAAHSARQWGYYHNRKLTIRRQGDDRLILFIHPKEPDKG